MSINQPRWKIPEYTIRQINDAGRTVRDNASAKEKKDQAIQVIDNWRSAHAYPLHVFYMNLRKKAGNRSDIIVAERLKRLDSIIGKLQREDRMDLYRMQDLGGCRMVLPTIDEVYSYSQAFQDSKIRHELKKINDYIQMPKLSGYRSLHLIYRFKTDTPEKEIYNRYNMLIELQFRTHLQHVWATAVEAFGAFTNQDLKAGQGDEAIKRFFTLVSSLFAIREGCTIVPNTIEDESELISEIEMIDDQFHVLEMLRAIKAVIDRDADRIPDKRGYYILQLDYKSHMLTRWFFKPSEMEFANRMYDYLESKKGNKPIDVVLVRASSYLTVKSAFPNYFMDIGEFVRLVTEYLK